MVCNVIANAEIVTDETSQSLRDRLWEYMSLTLTEREEIAQLQARIRQIENRTGPRIRLVRSVLNSMGAERFVDLSQERHDELSEKLDAAFKLDAHLTQPAQAVDAWMTDDGRVISARQKAVALHDGGASASSVAPYYIPLTAALPNANGKEGCQHEWEQVTERGKFCVHCGQIITHATFEYVPPQEDTPDAAR